MNHKLIRITTVPISLKHLIKGQMHFMSKNGFDVTMISADGEEINDVIKNEKCKHVLFPLTRKITPIKDLYTLIILYIFLKREKPLIVHTHTPKAGIIGMLASYLAKVPNRLHTVAGLPLLESKGFKRVILNFVEKLTYKCATKVYPNSYGLKKIILKNRFVKENKLKLIGDGSSNGIDTSFFNPKLFSIDQNEVLRSKLGIKKNDFVFIFVGRIVSDKGINELVEAFDKFSNTYKNVKLLLVGPHENELDPISKETNFLINYNKKIIALGDQNDVRPFFSIANLLVFPSYREGFPNVVLQACSMGIPSIVTDINGCNEIIENNVNGIIIPVKNVKALLDSMKKICLDNLFYDKLKISCRTQIKNKYEQKLFWKKLLKEYKNL